MSKSAGGSLVVLDRLGRYVKRYALPSGLATLGRDPDCDIRIMLPNISLRHATLLVKANQTVVRNLSQFGNTKVNGRNVSVAALHHNDIIKLGGRNLRWEYTDPDHSKRNHIPDIPIVTKNMNQKFGGRISKVKHRNSEIVIRKLDPDVKLKLEMEQRSSLPEPIRQVAIVKPQRRGEAIIENFDVKLRLVTKPHRPYMPNSIRRKSKASTRGSNRSTNRLPTGGETSPSIRRQSNSRVNQSNSIAGENIHVDVNREAASNSVKLQRDNITHSLRQKSLQQVTNSSECEDIGRVSRNSTRTTKEHESHSYSTPTETSSRKTYSRRGNLTTDSVLGNDTETKASRWIASRKSSPETAMKEYVATPRPPSSRSTTVSTPTSLRRTPKVTSTRTSLMRQAVVNARLRQQTPCTPASMSTKKKPINTFKIQEPLLDVNKKAALMLLTGRTPKYRVSTIQGVFNVNKETPSSSARNISRGRSRSIRNTSNGVNDQTSMHMVDTRKSNISIGDVSQLSLSLREESTLEIRSLPPSPRKSALKSPTSARGSRKTESIKFDLSNLENVNSNKTNGISLARTSSPTERLSDEHFTLRYSESSRSTISLSPSPRRSIHSGSKLRDEPVAISPSTGARESTRFKPVREGASTGTLRDYKSANSTLETNGASSIQTVGTRTKAESYSIVDLVSADSTKSLGARPSAYDSATSMLGYEVPSTICENASSGRSTRASGRYSLIGTSTPYVKNRRSKSESNISNLSKITVRSSDTLPFESMTLRKSSSITRTPEYLNVSKSSRKRKNSSRIFTSSTLDKLKRSKKGTRNTEASFTRRSTRTRSDNAVSSLVRSEPEVLETSTGPSTPDNTEAPEEAMTPILNIKRLLDASSNDLEGASLRNKKNSRRKTVEYRRGGDEDGARMRNRRTWAAIESRSDRDLDEKNHSTVVGVTEEEKVTPKSTAKPRQEALKGKHSTAKKPISRRTIIDNLDESLGIAKQLFNSPVKRKLSQSMTEYGRRQKLSDEESIGRFEERNKKSNSAEETPEKTFDFETVKTPEIAAEASVSTIGEESPGLAGVKRLFSRNTSQGGLDNLKGVKKLLRSPRVTRKPRDDLTDVAGVKALMLGERVPRNRSMRVSGVKALFKTTRSPRNDLTDVKGIKNLFAPENQRNRSPRNSLSDLRGVKRMFQEVRSREDHTENLSGVEELFNRSNDSLKLDKSSSTEILFDRMIGRPPISATYSKSKSFTQCVTRDDQKQMRKTLGAHVDNVEEWLEQELKRRVRTSYTEAERRVPASDTLSESKAKDTKLPTRAKRGIRQKHSLVRNTRKHDNAPQKGDNSESNAISKVISESDIKSQKTGGKRKNVKVELVNKRTLRVRGAPAADNSKDLPTDKKTHKHSTPLKSRPLKSSIDLGRLSPIVGAPEDGQRNQLSSKGSTWKIPESPEPPEVNSPPRTRTRRGKKLENFKEKPTKQRRPSLVITKKTHKVERRKKVEGTAKSTVGRVSIGDQDNIVPSDNVIRKGRTRKAANEMNKAVELTETRKTRKNQKKDVQNSPAASGKIKKGINQDKSNARGTRSTRSRATAMNQSKLLIEANTKTRGKGSPKVKTIEIEMSERKKVNAIKLNSKERKGILKESESGLSRSEQNDKEEDLIPSTKESRGRKRKQIVTFGVERGGKSSNEDLAVSRPKRGRGQPKAEVSVPPKKLDSRSRTKALPLTKEVESVEDATKNKKRGRKKNAVEKEQKQVQEVTSMSEGRQLRSRSNIRVAKGGASSKRVKV